MSDSPTAPSGFGNVSRFVCEGLAARGHTVDILGWQHRGEARAWERCTVHPVARDDLGADVLPTYLRRLRPDVLVTLADIWWLTWIADPATRQVLRVAGIPWVLYYPVDADLGDERLPPSWVHVLQTVDLPVAMSLYGQAIAVANGVRSAYVPHGVDTCTFRPPADKLQAKRTAGYGDRFVVLSDARNQPRKMLPRTLDVFARFAADKPDALLHLHCDPRDPAARSPVYCYDIEADVALLCARDPSLRGKVRFTSGMSIERGLSLDRLASLYAAADVHLLCSWGEGFGLPTLQAAASGVVPLAPDYTANRELVTGHGESVSVFQWLTDEFGMRRALIDVDDAVRRLNRLHGDRAMLARKSSAARRFAEPYGWSAVCDAWEDLLTSQVPGLRNRAATSDRLTSVMVGRRAAEHRLAGTDTAVAGAVRQVLGQLPRGATVTVSVAQSQAGGLTAEVLRDVGRAGVPLSLPVTLPPTDRAVLPHRVPGRIYAASVADVSVVRALARVLPGLTVWSDAALDLGPSEVTGDPVHVGPTHPRQRELLFASSTLALDRAGIVPRLPRDAARHGVPCLAPGAEARALWPELDGATAEDTAIYTARALLLDQSLAARVCANAARLLDRSTLATVGAP